MIKFLNQARQRGTNLQEKVAKHKFKFSSPKKVSQSQKQQKNR